MKKNIYWLTTLIFIAVNWAHSQGPGIQWQRCIGGSYYDVATGVLNLNEQEFMLTGVVYSNDTKIKGNHGGGDIYIAKMNIDGTKIWERCYGGSGGESGGIQKSSDGGFLLVGHAGSNDGDVSGFHGRADIWIAKLDKDGNIIWQRCIGGSDDDYVYQIKETPDGGYILTGSTASGDGDTQGQNHIFSFNMWVIKLNAQGSIVWQKTFGGSGYESGYRVFVLSDGSLLFAGTVASATTYTIGATGLHGASDIWLIKLDANGQVQWHKTYGGSKDEAFSDMQQTTTGEYIISGTTSSNDGDVQGNHSTSLSDVWILKIDSLGLIKWQKCIGGSSTESKPGFLQKDNGKIFVACNTRSYDGDVLFRNDGFGDILLVGLDTNGNIEWRNIWGGASADDITGLVYSPIDSSFIVFGNTISTNLPGFHLSGKMYNNEDFFVAKLNQTGNLKWNCAIGGIKDDYLASQIVLSDNSLILTGRTYSNDGDVYGLHEPSANEADLWVVRLGNNNSVSGYIYLDANLNGIKDADESFFNDVSVRSEKQGNSFTSSMRDGFYRNGTDTGIIVTKANPFKDYYSVTPTSYTSVFTTFFNSDTVNFAVQPAAGKRDVSVNLIPLWPARSGFKLLYQIVYKNVGTDTVSAGNIKFVLDSKLSFFSATPVQSAIKNDTLVWSYFSLKPLETRSIDLMLNVYRPPIVSIGDTIRSLVQIDQNKTDLELNDNTDVAKQIVTGSIDPNDKTEANAGVITFGQVAGGDYLNYLIRFQNTGTDTAFAVIVRDTLSDKLDWISLQLVKASHSYNLQISDRNKLTWTFDNIRLPDSNINEPASHGYIAYRIKPKSTVNVGDSIHNTASIYFDYNLPVITNMQSTTIKAAAPAFSGLASSYCNNSGIQIIKIQNLPVVGPVIIITAKIDNTPIAIAIDSSVSIDVNALTQGNHTLTISYAYGSTTLLTTGNFTVETAVMPQVDVSASNTNITSLINPVIISAINSGGGGANPLYTFAKDRNFTILWKAESSSNTLSIIPTSLNLGDNKIFVRMKTNATCYTAQTNTDSINIRRDQSTGIADIDNPGKTINIYPNPFNREILVKGLMPGKTYLLVMYNLNGQQVYAKKVSNRSSVTISNLKTPTGIYWLSLYDEKKKRVLGSVKLLKQ